MYSDPENAPDSENTHAPESASDSMNTSAPENASDSMNTSDPENAPGPVYAGSLHSVKHNTEYFNTMHR
jgi:hypothetical protein